MNEILRIAESFVKQENRKDAFHPDYEYSFDEKPIEYLKYWYFDFMIVPKKGVDQNEEAFFGGAPGFIISKIDKKAQVISWSEKNELEPLVN